MMFPLWLRVFFAVFLFLFGIVGLLTPIPAGWVMILASGVLVFWLRVVRRYSIRIFSCSDSREFMSGSNIGWRSNYENPRPMSHAWIQDLISIVAAYFEFATNKSFVFSMYIHIIRTLHLYYCFMKKYLFFILFFLVLSPSLYANESSEDVYTIEQACQLSTGLHLGKIVGLFDLYSSTFPDANYSVSSFHHVTDYMLGDALIFTVTDYWNIGEQRYSELFLVTCRVENRETLHFNIFGKRAGVQYSPEVTFVNRQYLILNDWENISGKSYHVVKIFDRIKNIFYTVDDSMLLKSRAIRIFVRNNSLKF